jgi:hypothetical protein
MRNTVPGSFSLRSHSQSGRRLSRVTAALAVLFAACAVPSYAQSGPDAPPPARTLDLSGPRFGMTMLSDGVVKALADRDITVNSTISQFGWQFEKQFYTKSSGVTALNEWVVLVGGLDQGVALPSVSWLVGLRTKEGAEFGIGPNVTPAGAALVVAAGVTFKAGVLNVPMNFAVVPTRSGTRVSILTGFTMRR